LKGAVTVMMPLITVGTENDTPDRTTPTLELQGVVRAQVPTLKQPMVLWTARHMSLNLAGTRRPMDTLWTAPAIERLRAVRAAVDTDNLIRANHTIHRLTDPLTAPQRSTR
jgi:hypothetical protein